MTVFFVSPLYYNAKLVTIFWVYAILYVNLQQH